LCEASEVLEAVLYTDVWLLSVMFFSLYQMQIAAVTTAPIV